MLPACLNCIKKFKKYFYCVKNLCQIKKSLIFFKKKAFFIKLFQTFSIDKNSVFQYNSKQILSKFKIDVLFSRKIKE